jgi:two-component system chemotaxis response regulator CheB
VIKILIVDDSALVRKLLGGIFVAAGGFEVEFARTGVEALEKIPTFDPAVVTLDVTMPVMDGLACLDRIMIEHPRPVVMVSSLTAAGAQTALEALRLGAVDVVAKPTGAVSLGIDDMAGALVEKVRSAASARLPSSLRLAERVRHRAAAGRQRTKAGLAPGSAVAIAAPARLAGDGLVLIGTSTGGPPALEAVLTKLEAGFPWPILIVQHMPAMFTSALAKRLDGLCALKIVEVSDATKLQPGYAYIARGDADMVVSRRGEALFAMAAPPLANYLWRPSVERMVRTAMEHVKPSQLIAVMMTGMGSDGAPAMTDLRAAGGRTIAESEDSAVVWGMPGELAKAGGAEWVVPLPEIAALVSELAPQPCP